MNKTALLAAALLTLAAGAASAETQDDYIQQNRTPVHSTLSRAAVQQQLVAAERNGDVVAIGEASSFGQQPAFVSARTRAQVQAEAVAAAHAANQNLDRRAFVDSRLPANMRREPQPQQASGGAQPAL